MQEYDAAKSAKDIGIEKFAKLEAVVGNARIFDSITYDYRKWGS